MTLAVELSAPHLFRSNCRPISRGKFIFRLRQSIDYLYSPQTLAPVPSCLILKGCIYERCVQLFLAQQCKVTARRKKSTFECRFHEIPEASLSTRCVTARRWRWICWPRIYDRLGRRHAEKEETRRPQAAHTRPPRRARLPVRSSLTKTSEISSLRLTVRLRTSLHRCPDVISVCLNNCRTRRQRCSIA